MIYQKMDLNIYFSDGYRLCKVEFTSTWQSVLTKRVSELRSITFLDKDTKTKNNVLCKIVATAREKARETKWTDGERRVREDTL